MDATLSLAGLIEESHRLLGALDFEGAENLLASALGAAPKSDVHLHFYLGRMYRQWNKTTSAINHLVKAAELAKSERDELLLLQIIEELKAAKHQQSAQMP